MGDDAGPSPTTRNTSPSGGAEDPAGSSQESGTEDEANEQLTGADLEQATDAALAEAGEGEVVEA